MSLHDQPTHPQKFETIGPTSPNQFNLELKQELENIGLTVIDYPNIALMEGEDSLREITGKLQDLPTKPIICVEINPRHRKDLEADKMGALSACVTEYCESPSTAQNFLSHVTEEKNIGKFPRNAYAPPSQYPDGITRESPTGIALSIIGHTGLSGTIRENSLMAPNGFHLINIDQEAYKKLRKLNLLEFICRDAFQGLEPSSVNDLINMKNIGVLNSRMDISPFFNSPGELAQELTNYINNFYPNMVQRAADLDREFKAWLKKEWFKNQETLKK